MSLLESNARSILESALADPIGILIRVSTPGDMAAPTLRAKQVLYRFKKDNRAFDCLQILFGDDPDHELWIIKKQPEEVRPRGFPAMLRDGDPNSPEFEDQQKPTPIEVEI